MLQELNINLDQFNNAVFSNETILNSCEITKNDIVFIKERNEYYDEKRKQLVKNLEEKKAAVFTIDLEQISKELSINMNVLRQLLTADILQSFDAKLDRKRIIFTIKEGLYEMIEGVKTKLDDFYKKTIRDEATYEILVDVRFEIESAIKHAEELGAVGEKKECERLLRTIKEHIKEFDV